MALDGQRDSSSSSSHRNLYNWRTLRAWSLFNTRTRSRGVRGESTTHGLSRSHSMRNCIGDGGSQPVVPSASSSRAHIRTRKTRDSLSQRENQPRSREGRRRRENDSPTFSSRLSFHEHGSRRRASLHTSENTSSSRSSRPNVTVAHHHHHHQHHDHHHHHYHYHHLYHHSSRQSNVYQDQEIFMPSLSSAADPSLWSGRRSVDQRTPLPNYSLSSFSNTVNIASSAREIAIEARNRLDERLSSVVPFSQRHSNAGVSGNFLEDFSMLFDDDDDDIDDAWSDDEMWELEIQDWLSAWGYGEGWRSDSLTSEQASVPQGLSKSDINCLRKEVYVPKSWRRDKHFGSTSLDQEDCSVCLERFLPGQLLINLPCLHRFHSECLTPWLESHSQCPYCRRKIMETQPAAAGNNLSPGLLPSSNDLTTWMGTLNASFSRISMR